MKTKMCIRDRHQAGPQRAVQQLLPQRLVRQQAGILRQPAQPAAYQGQGFLGTGGRHVAAGGVAVPLHGMGQGVQGGGNGGLPGQGGGIPRVGEGVTGVACLLSTSRCV